MQLRCCKSNCTSAVSVVRAVLVCVCVREDCESEICDTNPEVRVEKEVVPMKIPVHDALAVKIGEALHRLVELMMRSI